MLTMEKNMDYRFVLERNQAQENHACQFFSFFLLFFRTTLCWEPEILLPC